MNLDLTGKSALICGSTQGIGLACARELAELGASVTLVARDAAKLAAVLATLPLTSSGQHHDTLTADFSLPGSAAAAIKGASPARTWHILINNTGGPPGGPLLNASPEQFLFALQTQLFSAHALVALLVPGMKAARYGRIINIISTSVKQPIAGLGVSNTARGAVAAWAKTLAGELGPLGITVNNILPGYTNTDRLTALLANKAAQAATTPQAVASELMATIPAGRFGEATEIAAAAAFLASPSAGYINGINLPVDGGRLGCL